MSKSDVCENSLLELIFKNTNFALVGDVTGLRGSIVAGDFYVSLHTADPGEASDQTTSEVTYTSYARVPVARSGTGFVVVGNSVSPAADVTFPRGTGGSGTATHFGIGVASSGVGVLLYSGTVTPNIVTGSGISPVLLSTTTVTED